MKATSLVWHILSATPRMGWLNIYMGGRGVHGNMRKRYIMKHVFYLNIKEILIMFSFSIHGRQI